MVAVVRLQPPEQRAARPMPGAVQRRVGQVIERVQRLVAEEVGDGAQQEDAGQARAAQQPGHAP